MVRHPKLATANVLLASLFFFNAIAQAERLPLRTYTTADGLANNGVNKVVRDSRGFLWFCTSGGLSRFDGYAFTNFGVEEGLPDPVVNDFLETRAGDYWLATNGGLVHFNPRGSITSHPVYANESLSSSAMFVVAPCGTDAACTEIRRINVSAAFFLSIEFQNTGYLVERIYKTAYGDATGSSTFPSAHQLPVPVVRLNEFLSDTQEIGQGVVVGQGNWQQQIENNKQAFTAEFVQRTRFMTAFPNSMTAAQFVDRLNQNAGNVLSQSDRDQLVSDLSTNAKTRAQALRAVAENSNLNLAEFNRAFVLMQYFGYLRRNPNDPQDSDYTVLIFG